VAIAAATKPIAILRIMMLTPFVLSTPSLSETNPAVPIELRCAALLPGVPASRSHQGAGGTLGSPPCGRRKIQFARIVITDAGRKALEG
jgi:hypothetical protein